MGGGDSHHTHTHTHTQTDKAFSMELLQTKTKQRTQLKHGARKLYMYRVEDWDEVHVALRKEE